MEEVTIHIAPGNDKVIVKQGAKLSTIAPEFVEDPKTGVKTRCLAALVDHKLKQLDFSIFYPHEVQFIGYTHPEGRRTYIRSLSFVLQKAVRTLFPNDTLEINHSLPSGLYCCFKGRRVTDEEIASCRKSEVISDYVAYMRKQLDRKGMIAGLTALLQCSWAYAYIGQVMKESHGKANPSAVQEILKKKLA